tara:strand:- start:9661 stop:10296 length:636 start_codon:yes stop_codon:yes gene_type:complete
MTGKFITIEGIEGAGKTTCISEIVSIIEKAEIPFIQTREPGGTKLGEEVREILLDKRKNGMSTDAELLLMFSSRAEHLEKKILPAIESGKWVVCDRFIDASYAYQGAGRGIKKERIKQLFDWLEGSLDPDLTILLDLPVDQGMSRIKSRQALDRFESENKIFFNKIREGYLDLALSHPDRIQLIDSSRELKSVQEDINKIMTRFIHENSGK